MTAVHCRNLEQFPQEWISRPKTELCTGRKYLGIHKQTACEHHLVLHPQQTRLPAYQIYPDIKENTCRQTSFPSINA